MLTICCASLGSKGAFAIRHIESLRSLRIGWLRPAVLEANGGIVSTASLIVGVAAGDVATRLMAKDALTAHARDELGITEELAARLVQAAFASAATFTVGASLPLLLVLALPKAYLVWGVSGASLIFLAALGAVAARAGGSPVWRATARVTFWGALAMGLTAGVGALFGAKV